MKEELEQVVRILKQQLRYLNDDYKFCNRPEQLTFYEGKMDMLGDVIDLLEPIIERN